MKYIRGTSNQPLILKAKRIGILKCWIGGSLLVHPNMTRNTVGGISMVRWFPIVSSTKQKLNTQISSETEIAEVDDCIPAILWTIYWLNTQGCGFLLTLSFKKIKVLVFLKIPVRLQAEISQNT